MNRFLIFTSAIFIYLGSFNLGQKAYALPSGYLECTAGCVIECVCANGDIVAIPSESIMCFMGPYTRCCMVACGFNLGPMPCDIACNDNFF